MLYVRGMSLADLGLIGNCQLAAHVRRDGAIVWCCMPRFDSEPIFGALLDDDGGQFTIGPGDAGPGRAALPGQHQRARDALRGTGGRVPRPRLRAALLQYERSFRPTKLVRIVEPLAGTPRIRVSLRPGARLVEGAAAARARARTTSAIAASRRELRLTTDAPLSYLDGEPFALTERKHFVLSWGAPVEEPLEPLCERFLSETVALLADAG